MRDSPVMRQISHSNLFFRLCQRRIPFQRLPDTADMEEIMYRLYVLENIRHGQLDAEQGKTTSTEQLLREIQAW